MGYSYDSDNNLYEFSKWITGVGKVCDEQIGTFYETEINEKFSHFGYSEDLDGIQRLTLYGRMLDGDIDEGLNTYVLYHYKGVYNVDGQEYDAWAEFGKKSEIYGYAKDESGNPIYVLTERTAIGKGVIYRMIDEWGNDCPYDFKNIKFTKPIFSETDTPDSNLYYTFCLYDENSSNIKDVSIFENDYDVHNNVIKSYCPYGKQSLNRILFISTSIYEKGFKYNTFGNECSNYKFGNNCQYNTFGDCCCDNTFGKGCSGNTFGRNCGENTFGVNCIHNKLGDDCGSNKFGYYCDLNTFGNECCDNTFGSYCTKNTFGINCSNNTFGNYCESNTFGNDCKSNTFGNNCNNNTFGNR
jgi:hypothetical protein